MKRGLNTSYRLVWNAVQGAFVVVSELAKANGKRASAVLVAAGLVVSPIAMAEETTSVPFGEVVNGAVIDNHDTQRVSGETNDTVINTGLGPDSEGNGGGQGVEDGGVSNRTTINDGGLQWVDAGGLATDTTVNSGGGQSVAGQTKGTVLNGGEQYVHSGGVADGTVINTGGYQTVKAGGTATNTVVNTGSEGGPDSENDDAGQWVYGTAQNTTINANGRQVVQEGGVSTATVINSGGDQSVHGYAEDTVLDGGYQYVHSGGVAVNTTINSSGWQVVKEGAQAHDTTVNSNGIIQVNAGGVASDVTINAGGALVTNTDADVSGTNRLGGFSVDSATGSASNVVLENGGQLNVFTGDSASATTVDNGGTLSVAAGGTATDTTIYAGGALIADTNSTVSGTNAQGEFSIDGSTGQASGLYLENGGYFSVLSGGNATNTTVSNGGELSVADGGTLSGTTSLSNNATLAITGDVVSTGTIENAGTIDFASPQANVSTTASDSSDFTPHTLTTTSLVGNGGTINMSVNLDDPAFPTDMLIIDGGQATGTTNLNITNTDSAGLGLATTGEGIKVVDAVNGATTDDNAFALSQPLQAGAYNYTLDHGTTDEDWYLSSEAGYRAEAALYSSMLTQSMDYDRLLAGSYNQRSAAQGGQGVWARIQGGHIGHDDNGGIAGGDTPESSGSYGFIQIGADLLRRDTGPVSLTTGIYGAAGLSSVDVKNDDYSDAGDVRDNVYSLGGYLTMVHNASGGWVDMVAQGSRHYLEATSDNNDFNTHGWGWLGSLETGLPLSVGHGLVLEPQIQYIWQGLSLEDGYDNGGYVNFGDGSAQHLRAGLRFGNMSEMAFGRGSSSQAGFGDSMKHRASELPVNWWVRPSVIRTFSSDGDMSMGTDTAGSNVIFSPSQDGTSLDLQVGVETLVRQNVSLGVQGGYTRSVSGESADGYNGQATLKVTF
ncbi:autotransporter adhesin Ag43 [Salmonella enterica]|uniref:Autotransporter adhesin Ag43 n=1 Tax=Salmonella enterica subsp. salamae TaxID=59202 RepID=A0A5Y3X3M4_SALER|nr:autotransporter adhesin Ag43 [Salmonella enterica]ECJ4504151.1 autotransporter adhesin Ag43 [Salmonella enterica subsp. salamae]EDV3119330.1 autotransporter adhesin Ag43 [Salmonella enterica subsp. enterica]EDX4487085.1 autotransporter adhesin Ag43 [Salmonella enterica subsp. salamae]EGU9000206.1 autotransporter adhesin Ag43 [Salmonella enterica]